MLKELIVRIGIKLASPIRMIIREELRSMQNTTPKDLGEEMQRRALRSSVDYIEKNMRNVDSTASSSALITAAMSKASSLENSLICEFGVFSGSSINHIAQLTSNHVFGFDSFEGLPERWRDGFGAGHFRVPQLPKVRNNVTLVKGWFDQSLPPFLEKNLARVGFLHIDCDLYSSTKTIFDLLETRIKPGCVIVFDEYFNYCDWENGEYKAFQEFIAKTDMKYEYIGYNRHHEQVAVIIVS